MKNEKILYMVGKWLRLDTVFAITKFAFIVIMLVILAGYKDFFVEFFASSPELGGLMTWCIVVIFLIKELPVAGPRKVKP